MTERKLLHAKKGMKQMIFCRNYYVDYADDLALLANTPAQPFVNARCSVEDLHEQI